MVSVDNNNSDNKYGNNDDDSNRRGNIKKLNNSTDTTFNNSSSVDTSTQSQDTEQTVQQKRTQWQLKVDKQVATEENAIYEKEQQLFKKESLENKKKSLIYINTKAQNDLENHRRSQENVDFMLATALSSVEDVEIPFETKGSICNFKEKTENTTSPVIDDTINNDVLKLIEQQENDEKLALRLHENEITESIIDQNNTNNIEDTDNRLFQEEQDLMFSLQLQTDDYKEQQIESDSRMALQISQTNNNQVIIKRDQYTPEHYFHPSHSTINAPYNVYENTYLHPQQQQNTTSSSQIYEDSKKNESKNFFRKLFTRKK